MVTASGLSRDSFCRFLALPAHAHCSCAMQRDLQQLLFVQPGHNICHHVSRPSSVGCQPLRARCQLGVRGWCQLGGEGTVSVGR